MLHEKCSLAAGGGFQGRCFLGMKHQQALTLQWYRGSFEADIWLKRECWGESLNKSAQVSAKVPCLQTLTQEQHSQALQAVLCEALLTDRVKANSSTHTLVQSQYPPWRLIHSLTVKNGTGLC